MPYMIEMLPHLSLEERYSVNVLLSNWACVPELGCWLASHKIGEEAKEGHSIVTTPPLHLC